VVIQLQEALDRLPADAATAPLAENHTPIPWAAP
jgi:hypothetical protein